MKLWQCSICGYVHEAERAPDNCPVCGKPRDRFTPAKQRKKVTAFDPFNDRRSRDIRNTLSEAMVRSLEESDIRLFDQTVHTWMDKQLDVFHSEYIQDRQKRFAIVFDDIQRKHIQSILHQAVILWNQKLFFEMHELLETIWHSATGDMREALKGLITSAGAYMHMELKRKRPAEKMSQKAANLLNTYKHCLPIDLEELIVKLNNLDFVPPILEMKKK